MARKKKDSDSSGKRKTRPRYLWLKIIAILLAIPTIAVGIVLIHYYYVFDGLIEQKLGKDYTQAETEIFALPTTLFPGKRVNFDELQTKLKRLGYREGSEAPGKSTFEITKSYHLRIHNEELLPEDAGRTVEVACSASAIQSITLANGKTSIAKFSLKPEMLSNAINKNREKRRFVLYQNLPKSLINAVLASEDRRFFSHSGIDPIRIVKALFVDLREGETVQGASTLTQQFVKNYFLTPEKTWRRKFADGYMSILLEKRLTKEQIFELYSNEVYLGQAGSFSILGFGEAADLFFNKNVKDLTIGEAAILAGIITAPNRYTPLRYPERAKARRNLVLDAMADEGMITARECDEAKAKPIEVKPSALLNYSEAPYFVDYVQDILTDKFGELSLGQSKVKIYTTLDMDLQQAAFESLCDGVKALDEHFAKGKRGIAPGTVQASLIAVDPRNGQVLAMIGGRSYGSSQFNRITQSKRQPGSIFKPIVYAAALETAYESSTPLTVASTVLDEPTQFAFDRLLYEPKNFQDEYQGQVTMRQAIKKSLNIATIKFAEITGYPKIVEMAHRLGLNEQIKPYPAMAIGSFEVTPLEMVRAYTAIANHGLLSDLSPVYKITDRNSNPIFTQKYEPKKVLTPELSFMVTSLMQSVINNGTGAGARSRGFTLPAAGKTGTSHDGWFAGFTPDMLCIVWVGFDDNRELNLSGSQAALPIWTDFMKKATLLKPLSGEEFEMPEGIVEVEIDPTTGLLATERCLERLYEYFIKGSEPVISCYGNNYEQMVGGDPASIYAPTPKPATPELSKPPSNK